MGPDIALPPPHVVQIWYACLDQPQAVVAALKSTLAADELKRLHRFHFAGDARRYIVRRGLLRHLLAAYLELGPAEIVLRYGAQNKPALAGSRAATDLRFNLSDSGEMAVYAFAVGQEIGIDIELQREYPDALQMADHFFSRVEGEWLHRQPAQQRTADFLRCWTCKEAVVKALGGGLTMPLSAFTVAHWQTPPQVHWPRDAELDLSVHALDPPQGYIASLAIFGNVQKIHQEPYLV